ncbi:MAG: homocysteine S-methyltransferase family protein [Candidatus Pelagibacter sp. TMED118]|nr:MAG: homocysteine S-methyltransferase family protein [Candidatus Pelagibacter sp. TMED118]|tara:strand:+ start:558 stop:1472 length:915 start_codon:yes stop_codon:yes gene_type:complete
MDKNFFRKLRILDGGMGQELHANGLVSKGTLWSTSAVINEKYHDLIIDCHLAYISAGAEVIITNNFSSRRIRMEQNKVNHLFEFVNKKACELALKAREKSKKKIFIGGSIPAQHDTYKEDTREKKVIYKAFSEQLSCIKNYVDFFYLDVLSSGREIGIASEIIDKYKKPILVGIHLTKNGKLPSGETITEVIKKYKHSSWIGIIASCVSMEIAENSISEFKKQNLPFGFKVNLWGDDEPSPVRKINSAKYNEDAVNLNTVMGKKEVSDEEFKNLGKKFIENGATIIGGCCETNPSHIRVLSSLR